MKFFIAIMLLILLWDTPAAEVGIGCDPALETGIPCSPCRGKNCKYHPAYLRPGSMGKEKEREAYARP